MCSALGRKAEANPAIFVSVSGHINAVANMHHEVKDMSDMQCDEAKTVSLITITSGR
jgi:hypothetical protein